MPREKKGKDIVLNVSEEMHQQIQKFATSLDMPMGQFLLRCAFGGMPETTKKLLEARRREKEQERKEAEAYDRRLAEISGLLGIKTEDESSSEQGGDGG